MYMKENVSITVQPTILQVMKDYYRPYLVNAVGEYIDFQANVNDVVITAYLSRKENKKVVFF